MVHPVIKKIKGQNIHNLHTTQRILVDCLTVTTEESNFDSVFWVVDIDEGCLELKGSYYGGFLINWDANTGWLKALTFSA
jgi:hypothetical protein